MVKAETRGKAQTVKETEGKAKKGGRPARAPKFCNQCKKIVTFSKFKVKPDGNCCDKCRQKRQQYYLARKKNPQGGPAPAPATTPVPAAAAPTSPAHEVSGTSKLVNTCECGGQFVGREGTSEYSSAWRAHCGSSKHTAWFMSTM